jgi:hypothetical protein
MHAALVALVWKSPAVKICIITTIIITIVHTHHHWYYLRSDTLIPNEQLDEALARKGKAEAELKEQRAGLSVSADFATETDPAEVAPENASQLSVIKARVRELWKYMKTDKKEMESFLRLHLAFPIISCFLTCSSFIFTEQ